jgi:hypothetical protein
VKAPQQNEKAEAPIKKSSNETKKAEVVANATASKNETKNETNKATLVQ